MNSNSVFGRAVLAFCLILLVSLYGTFGMPDQSRAVDDASGADEALHRPKRQQCVDYDKFGCHNGYCWARCNALDLGGTEWCYTTRGKTQDRGYVRCKSDFDCGSCWSCGGPCAVV